MEANKYTTDTAKVQIPVQETEMNILINRLSQFNYGLNEAIDENYRILKSVQDFDLSFEPVSEVMLNGKISEMNRILTSCDSALNILLQINKKAKTII
jgi:hypothetical protein